MRRDEGKLREERLRALAVEQLCEGENGLFAAMAEHEALLTKQWQDSPPSASEAREALWRELKVMTDIRAHLASVIKQGAGADRLLKQAELDSEGDGIHPAH